MKGLKMTAHPLPVISIERPGRFRLAYDADGFDEETKIIIKHRLKSDYITDVEVQLSKVHSTSYANQLRADLMIPLDYPVVIQDQGKELNSRYMSFIPTLLLLESIMTRFYADKRIKDARLLVNKTLRLYAEGDYNPSKIQELFLPMMQNEYTSIFLYENPDSAKTEVLTLLEYVKDVIIPNRDKTLYARYTNCGFHF